MSTKNCSPNNRIWTGRTKGIGYISLEDMIDLGVTGPMLRAAGLKIDIRKDAPYSSYEKFDFEVPTRTGKRRVRALPGAHRGNARNRCRSSSRRSKACRPARIRRTRPASCCRIAKR